MPTPVETNLPWETQALKQLDSPTETLAHTPTPALKRLDSPTPLKRTSLVERTSDRSVPWSGSDSGDRPILTRLPSALKDSNGERKLFKRAMTTGRLGETVEYQEFERSPTPVEPEEEQETKRQLTLEEKVDFLIDLTLKNTTYTKAIYASTKKSINGPGHEVGMLPRMSIVERVGDKFDRSSTMLATVAQTTTERSARSSCRVLAKASTRETIGKHNSTNRADKVTNMLELTRYIMRQNKRKSRRAEIGSALWRFLEDRSSSREAYVYSVINHLVFAASVILACIDVIDSDLDGTGVNFSRSSKRIVAIVLECCFTIELLLRFSCCPTPKVFWLNRYNIIDALSAAPILLRVVTLFSESVDSSQEVNAVLSLVPVLRLCKLLRRFETFHLLASAFRTSTEALPVLLFTMMLINLTFSAVIYYVEPRSTVKSYSAAIWYVTVTMCGVAPGEPTPSTAAGKMFTGLLMLCGILYMAIPIGIIGAAFSHVWEERSRLLLMQRMRTCVERVGYTPSDLMAMFTVLDQNRDGSLDFEEFSAMLDVMQIGVEEKFVMEVFESFDADCEGSIDFRELLRGLFPHTHRVYIDHTVTEETRDRDVTHSSGNESSFLLIAKSSKGTTETKLRASAEVIAAASRSFDEARSGSLRSTISPLAGSVTRTMSPAILSASGVVHYPKHVSRNNSSDHSLLSSAKARRLSAESNGETMAKEHFSARARSLSVESNGDTIAKELFATDQSAYVVAAASMTQQADFKKKELISLGSDPQRQSSDMQPKEWISLGNVRI